MQLIEYASDEKLRGGFYTPDEIAEFILRWAVNGGGDLDILEPGCGEGVFLKHIKNKKIKFNSLTAIELNKEEAEKARNINLEKTEVITGDFLAYCNSTDKKFNVIIGNPPYIRYQYQDEEQKKEAELLFSKAGLKYNRLSNLWASFVMGSILMLKETGKIGFVLPAEILQVSFAKQLRVYLAKHFNKINIISFKKLVFIDQNGNKIQQEVILLLCEKNENGSHLIEHLEVNDIEGLKSIDVAVLKSPKKRIDFKSNKWTFYFLSQKEIDFIERLLHQKKIPPLRNYAKVEVGMTTGSNAFFTVPEDTVREYELQEYAEPMVGRSVQVSSIIFTKQDWRNNIKAGARAYFLKFPKRKQLEDSKAEKYLEKGEKNDKDKYYKTRIRDEWQIVPSAWVSEALFLRRNHLYPRMVINKAGAYTTDTMHRVTIDKNAKLTTGKTVDLEALVGSYYNSLSFAFAEISGRSYGGGVLELMPNEVEDILIPYHEKNAELVGLIDNLMREEKPIDEILKVADNIILHKRAGLTHKEIKLANNIWKKLVKRRMTRNGTK